VKKILERTAEMSASSIMNRLNANALRHRSWNRDHFIEDVRDPDGRWYRIEYICDHDGCNVVAFCRFNPWGANPYSYHQSHLRSDGFICYAGGLHSNRSPYNLDYAVERVRFWCTGYSYLREHGYAATCRDIPEWRG
jgi:hypothetical protein